MNDKTGLIRLGTTLAIALLLPTQAKALPSLEETNAPSTSLEPLPEIVLAAVAKTEVAGGISAKWSEGMPEHESPAVFSPDVVPPESQVAEASQAADATAEEVVNPEATPNPDLSHEAQGTELQLTEDPWLPLSTSSRDLQGPEASLVSEDLLPTPLGQPLDVAQTTEESSPPDTWHFLLKPYIYLPLSISGSANFNNLGGSGGGSGPGGGIDFELEPNQIRTALRNNLNFALFSGFEAWNPNYRLGILSNFEYVSLSAESTVERDVRFPGLSDFIPTQINVDLTTQLMRADLAGSYRFYDPARVNPEGIRSEYDLGPFVFDVLGGLSLSQVNTRLGLTTNLGGSGQFNNSRTVVSPLIGGRARWNAAPNFALVGTGTISGFGISGLMQYGLQGGVDWMFSGNTTLGAGYRFGFTDYNASRVDLNVNQHGPYINIGFRF